MTTSNSTENDLVISYMTMRKAVGWLGMLLPFTLLIGNYFINRINILNQTWFVEMCPGYCYKADGSFKSSISHYYYSTVGELFTGTLCAVALFMFCYKGHPKRIAEKGLSDSMMTNLAGLFALGVIVFPTSSDSCIGDNIRSFLSSRNTGFIHFGFAALFFFTLAFMSIINFRRSKDKKLFGMGPDDNFYLVCGIVMLVCIGLIFIYSTFLEYHYAWLDAIHPTFILEAVALIAFGLSWLRKGQTDFNYIPKKLKLIKS